MARRATAADDAAIAALWNTKLPIMQAHWPEPVGELTAEMVALERAAGPVYISDDGDGVLTVRTESLMPPSGSVPVTQPHPLEGVIASRLVLWAPSMTNIRELFRFWFGDVSEEYAFGWVYRSIVPPLLSRLETWPFQRADYTNRFGTLSLFSARIRDARRRL